MLTCTISGWWSRDDTNIGLALVGRNSRGTQALKQNIAGELGGAGLMIVVDSKDGIRRD